MERTEQKNKAIELMKKLKIFDGYIEDFKSQNKVTMFETFIGFWVEQHEEIQNKMKEIEMKYNSVCYAITHEETAIGEMYSFLLVPEYEEEWDSLVTGNNNDRIAFAYVWNKSDDEMSELGYIAVKSWGGGIKRVG